MKRLAYWNHWLSLRERLGTATPFLFAAGLVLTAFWLTAPFIAPAPPKTITIATASKGSPYYAAAERYRAILAESGVELKIIETKGSIDNLERITTFTPSVDAAFVQGGLANANDAPNVRSIGQMFLEPVWIFYNGSTKIEKLTALAGKRILIGPLGSGTAALATHLLEASGITADTATLINGSLPDAVGALDAGTADAAFLVLAPEARTIQRLFHSPHVHLMNIALADAYVQRFAYLQVSEIKEGVVDFAQDIPPDNTRILATTAALVVRDDLHPALVSLLTQAAITVHGGPWLNKKGESDLFHRARVFPQADDQEFPLSAHALRVYRSGSPFLQRYLPFWLATMVDRLTVLLLPIIGILLPAIRFAPAFYSWKVRRRLFYWYRELMTVEAVIGAQSSTEQIDATLREIDRIDRAVNRLPIPLAFANQLYDLRGHLGDARARLLAQRRP